MMDDADNVQPSTQDDGDAESSTETADAPKEPAWARLIALPPHSTIGVLEIREISWTLGRSWPKEMTSKITEVRVSGKHCMIACSREDPDIWLYDIGQNGTYLNSKRIGKGNREKLKSGDTIALLDPSMERHYQFLFQDLRPPPTAPVLPAAPAQLLQGTSLQDDLHTFNAVENAFASPAVSAVSTAFVHVQEQLSTAEGQALRHQESDEMAAAIAASLESTGAGNSDAARKRPCEVSDQSDEAAHKRFRSEVDDGLAHLVCAITHELPVDPVTAMDGRIYERSAIEEWLQRQHKSPITNVQMGPALLPAPQVKAMIEAMAKSGAISGDKGDAWQKRIKEQQEFAKVKEAADGGNTSAMRELGRILVLGLSGQKKDLAQASKWCERAAKGGDLIGLGMFGVCLYTGLGTQRDMAKGLMLITEAAARGDSQACLKLGQICLHGLGGMTKDTQQARRWLEKAASFNSSAAKKLSEAQRAKLEGWLAELPSGESEWKQ